MGKKGGSNQKNVKKDEDAEMKDETENKEDGEQP